MKIIDLKNNSELLVCFVNNLDSRSFRYFDSRPLTIVSEHLYSCLFIDRKTPFAYGHLDAENDKIWLGIAIIAPYQRKGYGLKMMNHLFEEAKKRNVSHIYLSVDCDNFAAFNLYRDTGFQIIIDNTPKNYIMLKNII